MSSDRSSVDFISTELLIEVFRLLDLVDILACLLTYRRFRAIIQDSAEIQHCFMLQAAGVEEHKLGDRSLSVIDRSGLLRAHQEAWRAVSVARVDYVTIPEINGGPHIILLLGGRLFFSTVEKPYGVLTLPILAASGPMLPPRILDVNQLESPHLPVAGLASIAFSEEQDLVAPIIMSVLSSSFFQLLIAGVLQTVRRRRYCHQYSLLQAVSV
jgi:hypothetical protein